MPVAQQSSKICYSFKIRDSVLRLWRFYQHFVGYSDVYGSPVGMATTRYHALIRAYLDSCLCVSFVLL